MKLLAATFAAIALLAVLLGFSSSAIPFFSVLGKATALIALAGCAVTAVAYSLDELIPDLSFDVNDIHP